MVELIALWLNFNKKLSYRKQRAHSNNSIFSGGEGAHGGGNICDTLRTDNREICILHLYSTPTYGGYHRNFAKMFNIGENICWNKYYVKLFPYNSLQERDGRKDTAPSTDCPWTPLLIRDIETSMDCPSGVRDTLLHSPLSAIRRFERRAEGTPFSALHRWTLTPPPKLTTRLRHCFACACDGSLLYLVLVWVSVVEIRCLWCWKIVLYACVDGRRMQ